MAEVLRQKFRLGLDTLVDLESMMNQVQENWPTNLLLAEADLLREWKWKDGRLLQDTWTRTVYRLLDLVG